MSHLTLLIVCTLSVEVFIRFNFLLVLSSILKVTKKVRYVIFQDNISDHWKEKVCMHRRRLYHLDWLPDLRSKKELDFE